MDSRNIEIAKAYKAMFFFLEKYYRDTQSDDVGSLLGEMSLLPDGSTADPASWNTWLECVQQAINDPSDESISLNLKKNDQL